MHFARHSFVEPAINNRSVSYFLSSIVRNIFFLAAALAFGNRLTVDSEKDKRKNDKARKANSLSLIPDNLISQHKVLRLY